MKTGIVAGIVAAVTLAIIGFIIWACVSSSQRRQADAQSRENGRREAAEGSLSPEFTQKAQSYIQELSKEQAASAHGWRAFEAQEKITDQIRSSFPSSIHTHADRDLAIKISEEQSGYSDCIREAIGPGDRDKTLSGCEKASPVKLIQAELDLAMATTKTWDFAR